MDIGRLGIMLAAVVALVRDLRLLYARIDDGL